MKNPIVFGTGVWLAFAVCAPTGIADEGTALADDPLVTDGYSFSWWGESGKTYFLQYSHDLENWTYFPTIDAGAGATISYGFVSSVPRGFYRYRSSDAHASNPLTADFDFDGVGNNDELTAGTDPLAWADADADNLPDDWESFYSVTTPEADPDGDGLSNLIEFAIYGTSPNTADATVSDTDSDGVGDALDAFPDDATKSAPSGALSGDTTAPTITLTAPSGAVAQ